MTHIHNYNVPHRIVTIAEDATRVIARVDYDNETDRCIGFVLPIDKHGLPKTDSFLATSFSSIEKMFAEFPVARYAYVYMAQPVHQNVPPFCLSCLGTNNKFTAQEVLLRWKYIADECATRNITIISFGGDGDSRVLKAMNVCTSLSISKAEPLLQFIPSSDLELPIPKSWFSWFHIKPISISFVQDIVHIAVKLKSRLLKPSVVLPMGQYTATSKHLFRLQTTFAKDLHGLRDKDISHKDRQNFDAVLHIVKASHLLDKLKDANATKCYIELIGCIVDSYLDKSLDAVKRVEKIWYAVFVLRYWRQWILLHPSFTLKNNFITSNAYMCVEMCAHALVTFLITLRHHFPEQENAFLPWLLGSQTCEATFRAIRSMSSIFSTIINFGMLGLLRRLHRLQVQFTIQADVNSGIIFPGF